MKMRSMMVAVILGAVAMVGCRERGGQPAPLTPVPTACAPLPAPAPSALASAASPAPATAQPAAPAPEPRKTMLGGDERLTVKRLVLARGVRNREPVDAARSFQADAGRIYAFVEVENSGRAPGEIVVEFEPPGGGAPHGDVKLAVGAAPHWRTWAYTRTANTAGSWTAVVKNRKGDVLARAPFEVTL